MTLQEILDQDTSNMSLTDMINQLTPSDHYDEDVLQLRLRHEDDTGIPMEEDEIGEEMGDLAHQMFPGIEERLQNAEEEMTAD